MAFRVHYPGLVFLLVWISFSLVFSGWLTWSLQAKAEGNRRQELQSWCDKRARSLSHFFLTSYNVLQVFPINNPWLPVLLHVMLSGLRCISGKPVRTIAATVVCG